MKSAALFSLLLLATGLVGIVLFLGFQRLAELVFP